VTEETFLGAVDGAHPASRALTGELGAAEAERLRAALLSDPRLQIGREELEGVERETIWGVAWTPPVDGRRRWAIRAAEAGVEAERNRLESRLLELRRDVRDAYAAWATGATRVELMVENSSRLEELAERMRHRAEAGEESLLDARRLEIAHESSKLGLSQARASAAGARARAAAWLVDDALDLSTVQPAMPALEEMPDDLDSALRPDLRAARSRVEQAEASARSSRRVAAAPEVLLGWKSFAAAGDNLEGPVLALSWQVPVFDRRRADRKAAESAVSAADAQTEWATRRAAGDLAAAAATYDELRQSALAAQRNLGSLDEVARAATAAYEQGESRVTDLLDGLRAVLEVRLAALDLYIAALEAHRQLELAVGRSLTFGGLS
jgi:outer membrane protein TolC